MLRAVVSFERSSEEENVTIQWAHASKVRIDQFRYIKIQLA